MRNIKTDASGYENRGGNAQCATSKLALHAGFFDLSAETGAGQLGNAPNLT